MSIAEIRLDPVGGIAGDMFAAAMADAFPERVPGLMAELAKLGAGDGRVRFAPHADGGLAGRRFVVEREDHDDPHPHVRYAGIRARLQAAGLAAPVLEHALGLFELMAATEGAIHGVAPDEVEFHEVGAWDSIVDFVAAAYFIASVAPARWSVGPLPLGGGRVTTAHGVLPVPAPATARLLQGLAVIDDGVGGERVTPTGAAIVRYLVDGGLSPASRIAETRGQSPVSLACTGHGFGTRKLPGIPNLLRVLVLAHAQAVPAPRDEEVAMLQFEIDDQTAEDLAVALERIRQAPGVLDACQLAAFGKKARLATQVQVLVRPEAVDDIAALCLAQTTTLGVRIARLWRRTALRAQVRTSEGIRVKVAERPTQITAKAEMDDIATVGTDRESREEARRRAQAQALETTKPHGKHDPHDD